MKLSAAIEQAITSGTYNQRDEYMCWVLRDMEQRDHIDAVQDMVHAIHPEGRRGYPLACALHDAGIHSLHDESRADNFEYTKQLYCWWVFDLKRKGL